MLPIWIRNWSKRIHAIKRPFSHPQPSRTCRLEIERLEDRLAPAGILATGADAGGSPEVRVFDAATGVEQYRFLAYDTAFQGGVRVALGDMNRDGIPDIITTPGPGGGPLVEVFSGKDRSLLLAFNAYDPAFRGGVFVAVGDLNNDGLPDIIATPDAGGGPLVMVFDGRSGAQLLGFNAYDPAFRGGVHVTVGNVLNDIHMEIVTAPGAGGGPLVNVFSGGDGSQLLSFNAYDPGFLGGVFVAAGDVNKDRTADIITGPGQGGGPLVEAFSGRRLTLGQDIQTAQLIGFNAYDSSFLGGVRVSAVNGNGDLTDDILTGAGPGGPHVKVFNGATGHELNSFLAFDPAFQGGISVAGNIPRLQGDFAEAGPDVRDEVPVLDRLRLYGLPDASHPFGQFQQVTAGSISATQNVYVVVHGWAPDYLDWVNDLNSMSPPVFPLWSDTLTSTPSSPGFDELPFDSTGTGGGSTPWMFTSTETGFFFDNFTISPAGLAQQILTADPNAQVLLYSWIDDSATAGGIDIAGYLDASSSEAYTTMNGMRLANALMTALEPNFHADGGKVHLLGHSHGSKVVTVATQVLQAEAKTDPRFDVVKQISLLDSPEDQGVLDVAPTDLDAANLLWFHLAQLNISSDPLNPANSNTVFVDNYFSVFGNNYRNFLVNDPDQGINNVGLGSIFDVGLDAGAVFNTTVSGVGDMHGYAPAWYAGSATASGNVGLHWSPLLPSPGTPGNKQQQWFTNYNGAANQFVLDDQSPLSPRQPVFTPTPLTFVNQTSGVSFTGLKQAVTGVTLTETGGTAAFNGTFVKQNDSIEGFSFDYRFTQPGNGDQLQILLNGSPYFVMTGSVATPQGGTLHATFGLGYEDSKGIIFSGIQNLTLILTHGNSSITGPSTVIVSNFHTFTLGN